MTNNLSKKKTIKFLEESDSEISNKITLTTNKIKKEANLIKCFLRLKPKDTNENQGKIKIKNKFLH